MPLRSVGKGDYADVARQGASQETRKDIDTLRQLAEKSVPLKNVAVSGKAVTPRLDMHRAGLTIWRPGMLFGVGKARLHQRLFPAQNRRRRVCYPSLPIPLCSFRILNVRPGAQNLVVSIEKRATLLALFPAQNRRRRVYFPSFPSPFAASVS